MLFRHLLQYWLLGSLVSSTAWAIPRITDFTPRAGPAGATVSILGTGLGGVNAVNFNGTPATILSVSPTLVRVIVPPQLLNGPIYVRDNQGNTTDSGATGLLDFLSTPRIAVVRRVFPPAGTPAEEVRVAPGNVVEVEGANFLSFTDPGFQLAVRVDLSGLTGTVRLVPNSVGLTALQFTVPGNAVSGPVTVMTPVGTTTSLGDLYLQPILTRFTPMAAAGQLIELSGTSFKGASVVLFGDLPVIPTTVSSTNLTVRVPPIAAPVRLTLVTPGGAFLTATTFSLSPTIEGFTPAGGPAGTSVTINGTGLSAASKIRFGTQDAPIVSASPSTLQTVVPVAASTGPLTVITPFGTNVSSTNFFLPPRLSSVVPNRGKPGAEVAVNGSSLTGTRAVLIAGVPTVFQVISDTKLAVTVPEGGTTGTLVVENPGGTSVPGLAFTVLGREPIIDAFNPGAGVAGAVVTLSGLNFVGTTTVEFSNAPASSFSVKSDTNLTVTVPAGARTGPISVKNAFGTGRSLQNFVVGTKAALSLIASANPQSVLPGEPLVLNLRVDNDGPLPAADTTVTVVLPDGLDYVDSTLLPGSISFLVDGFTWEVGTVAPDRSALGYIRLRPRFVGNFTVQAAAASTTPDTVATDNQREVLVFALHPQLNLRGMANNELILGWPSRAVDYVVYATPALAVPDWRPVTNTPVEIQDELRISVPRTNREHWFRLAPR